MEKAEMNMGFVLAAVVAAIAVAAGHLVRDGTPALGNTQLARAVGSLLAGLGIFAVPGLAPLSALALTLAIWFGFYTDQQHAKGQNAGWGSSGTLEDIGWLAISGVTSVLPLALLAEAGALWGGNGTMVIAGLVLLLGSAVLKPVLWLAMWELNQGYGPNPRLVPALRKVLSPPTRPAATLFGAWIGVWVAIAVSLG